MPARPPVHFFSTQSPVVDLFLGQLDYAEYLRQESEITLYFLYAPWCAHSIATRAEIEQVAGRLADQALFVAVNCWWHHGKCRKQKNFFYFPVIHLYHKSFGPIEYKGPLTAAYIEKFIRRVMSPVLYISSVHRLKDFLSTYEPGILGYFEFNASPQPPGYLTFFRSALHSLQKDYIESIRYGVVTDGNLAKKISLTKPGSVYLHRNLNTSLVYPEKEMNFTAANICKWALERRETLLNWLRPHGAKSLLLNNELRKGPALLLFIPFNPLAEEHPLLDEIMEVALNYNNCTENCFTQPTLQETIDPMLKSFKLFSCCNTVVLPQWHFLAQVHNVCELCVNQTRGVILSRVGTHHCNFQDIGAALDSFYLKEQYFLGFMSRMRECTNFLSTYSPYYHYTACCQTINRGLIDSASSAENVPFALSSLGKNQSQKSLTVMPHIEEKRQVTPGYHISNGDIAGLRCRTNKTLNMYLLDSNISWLYAQRLGASGSDREKKFAAIIDVKEEIHYIIDQSQPLIRPTLEAFIQNYSKIYSPLQRHLVSDPPTRKLGHQLITEVTSYTFHHVVLDIRKDVLLLFYTTWCGFCASLTHIFIRLAQLLATDSLVIARINIAQNDLPWEFMVDHVPAIMLFPKNRKENSVLYPEGQQITVSNLLHFILKHTTLPSTAADPPASCPEYYVQYKEEQVSFLEQDIQRLRAEIDVLHKAQDQLAELIAEARKDRQDLKVQKQRLEQHNKALEVHKQQLQSLYEQKSREVGTMADQMKELVAASERLLAENALLKFVMVSLEANKGKAEAEKKCNNVQEGNLPSPDNTGISEGLPVGSNTEDTQTSDYNKTD
ncbi:PREDICTED: thioredoxin domain-containing protein 11 [Nanorana parkeri]|uniref:thioredoxin domain-containing protein 11 n=1 Tax=Nanorana parkeri TaxID=125878 RepID=UPI000854800A|nr:PREDICTED: thioredoxin domain-containing protein 11 [Nanorana parkeri]